MYINIVFIIVVLFVLGYIGSCSFLNKVHDFVTEMKGKNPNLIYGKSNQLISLRMIS